MSTICYRSPSFTPCSTSRKTKPRPSNPSSRRDHEIGLPAHMGVRHQSLTNVTASATIGSVSGEKSPGASITTRCHRSRGENKTSKLPSSPGACNCARRSDPILLEPYGEEEAMYSNRQLRKSISRTISHLVMLMLTMGMVAAMAQNTVPPTARQAAADPAFAARLARQVPAHPATKSQALIRSRRASPQDQILYDNGPFNGTTDAWTINFGFSTSESFTGGGPVTGLHFVYWDVSTSDLLTTVDISIGSTSFGGSPQTLTGVTNTFLGTNQYGYYLYQADYSFSGAGSGSYVTLSNACTTSGCSVSNPIYWDENSGPSTAYENTIGSIPSEAFSLNGGCTFDCPPQCVSDAPQGGFKIIHSFTSTEQSPASGLAVDPAGKLFGTTRSGGDNGLGLAYQLALHGQDWIFAPLYSFLGGAGGQNPLPEIVGPERALYGAADGGIQNCGSARNQYCGVVYRLRLSPFACPTALCSSWTENVIYQFTGDPDGWSPNGKLVLDQAGNLYGTTTNGGAYGRGTVYELTPSGGGWTEQVIYSFTANDGDGPNRSEEHTAELQSQ